jgi:hypothetical protein
MPQMQIQICFWALCGSASVWLLMVATKELGTYQPVDVLSMGDGVLGALVMTG